MPKLALPQQHGICILNKPAGPTSTQCLNKIKKHFAQKKIGHAGTLDPQAHGILIVLLGRGTKLAPFITEGRKVYKGTLCLGYETDTYDLQGKVVNKYDLSKVKASKVEQEILNWTKLKEQPVPPFSAVKHKGSPLYKLAREKKDIPKKNKSISIDQTEVLEVELPEATFRVACSHGTYIRSLAHSLGRCLGCGAVLTDLTREQSYPFVLEQASPLQALLDDPEFFLNEIIPLHKSLPHWPKIKLSHEQAKQVKQGIWLSCKQLPWRNEFCLGQKALFLSSAGYALALAQIKAKEESLYWSILRGL